MARILIALPLLLGVLAAPAHAGAARGAELFEENCADCHSVAKPLTNKKGPGLTGIVGRKAAAVPDFSYSAALRTANLTWTPDRLDAYLQAPKQLVPGSKMKFDGLPSADERRLLIDFLGQH
jgi:cytochrome c